MTPDDHVFLTGGTGFFGLALLRHWQQLGPSAPRLTILSREPVGFSRQHPDLSALAQWVAGDVMHPASLPTGQRFSHVLHAAADSTLGPQLSALHRYDQIVSGTRHLLDFARACGARRFLLTSSGGVYGRLPVGMAAVPEDFHGMPDPLQPDSAYSVAKRAAEHLTVLYSEHFEVVIARCFAFVGRDLPLDVHFAIGNFIRDSLLAPAITVNGDGTPLRSYLDQRDLAEWLLALLAHGTSGHAYNVGSGEALSISELAYRVRDLLAPGKPVRIMRQPRGTPPQVYVPDIRKALEVGLKQRISLDEAIVDTASHAHLKPTL